MNGLSSIPRFYVTLSGTFWKGNLLSWFGDGGGGGLLATPPFFFTSGGNPTPAPSPYSQRNVGTAAVQNSRPFFPIFVNSLWVSAAHTCCCYFVGTAPRLLVESQIFGKCQGKKQYL